ncbi:MAG: hypothetical protein JO125_16705 [Chloroflexi bacterium]|nr:hypothetical protein [Chloroflexota bacterium]
MSRIYCKAYHLKDLRAFPRWSEQAKEGETDLADDAIVYLWDDFTVVQTPVASDPGLLWDHVTPEWQEFCQTTLRFEIPEDLRSAYDEVEGRDTTSGEVVDAENKTSV